MEKTGDGRRETGDRRRETGDSIQETGDRRLFLFILPPQRARSDPPTPYTPHPTPNPQDLIAIS
ncbi:MAG: hypothetical protein NT917_22100 [Microcystis aeruginosa WS75]|nr:hypothetical protein [Microcystis aeruginosa WS75]